MHKDNIKVLIVDDEPIITLFLHDAIAEEGFRDIDICHDGESAIKVIKEKKPNIIFMDININGPVDGITLVKKYVNDDETIVFYISAYSDPATINEALESNPYSYLVKPISENDVKISLGVACNKLCKKPQDYNLKKNNIIHLSKSIYYDKKVDKIFDNGSEIILSKIEDKILRYLINNHDINVTCNMFREYVWQKTDIASTTIRDAISKLRKKLPDLHIETKFGSGYILKSFVDIP